MAFMGLHAVTYVAEADMLAQPKHYYWSFANATFLKYALAEPPLKESCVFRSGGIFELLNLTEGKARSRRIDIVYYDEMSDADLDAYNASEGTLSVSKFGLLRYGSTPKKGTPFETTIRRLQQLHAPVSIRTWQQLPHISLEFVQRVKLKYPPWYFRQEMECSFEAPMGRVFEHVIEGPIDLSHETNSWQRHYKHGGVDWNPSAGHWLIYTRWSDVFDKLYVISEHNMGTDVRVVYPRLVQEALANPNSYYELEDGGTNTGYCDGFYAYCYEHNVPLDVIKRFMRRPWDSAGKNKHNSISLLLPVEIYVNPLLCAEVAYWLGCAHWDAESPEPKLEKDPDQHALDSLLHSGWIGKWGIPPPQ